MKIKAIVFDMGNVILQFDYDFFLDREGVFVQEDRELIRNELFLSVEWAQMDLGVLDEKTAEPRLLPSFPEHLRQPVKNMLYNWADGRNLIPGMDDLVLKLKTMGYQIYLLSNASFAQHEYWPKYEISRLFDGKLISCDIGIVKPNPEIYRCFTRKFGLKGEECLFIDDHPANVAAAIKLGWNGIVFHGDAEKLKQRMKEFNIYSE